MYLADCHNHSCCSPDSQTPLEELVRAAAQAGLSELCSTDHLDLVGQGGVVYTDWDWQPVLEQYDRVRASCPRDLELRLGIEINGSHIFPERARQILDQAPLDMVIGSVHNMPMDQGGCDYIENHYTDEDICYRTLDLYFGCLQTLAGLDMIDILGHLPYVLRYMNERDGNRVTLDRYADRIDGILTTLIHRGAGIELNTNRNRGDVVGRWAPILKRYRRLGGEIITLGSDAHVAEHVGLGIPLGAQLLRDLGYRYYTVYRHRKPEFIPL